MKNFNENLQELIFTGELRCNEKGFGFVSANGQDFFVPANKMGQALNGDTVVVRKLSKRNDDDRVEIIKVEKRGITKLVGTVFFERGIAYVRPDDMAYFADIYISLSYGLTDGDKVFVQLDKFPKNRCPEGRVLSVIGKQFEFETEEASIILSKQIETEFSEEVKKFASNLQTGLNKQDYADRLDLRNELIFTIDGESARDYDDAVSLSVENGIYTLGVHIADVSHYVTQDSHIDREAFDRATSVYFPDRVIPMLPFELSNGICSLVEGEDRLTVSVIVKLDEKGEIIDTNIQESVIKSTHRLTYTLVDKIISGDMEAINSYSDIVETIKNMDTLRDILERKRNKLGYINLDVKESEITINNGEISVEPHKPTRATRLIEQFMILANEVVASFLYYQNLPAIYRVHDKPNDEKLATLKNFLYAIGIKINWRKDECYPSDFQRLLEKTKNSSFYSVINKVVLRSMQKAKYSPDNIGHFGLASECYCHFTSPIRRYPDLVVHRILKLTLEGAILPLIDLYEGFCTLASENSSKKERLAEEAEREVDKLYRTKYMASHVGEEFVGVISSVLSSGFFVELENTCEGFVSIELLPAGTYTYDKDSMCLSARKRKYKLGDKVKICVLSADILTRRVDLALAK